MGAYVSLLEYNGIEGMILLSELSRRRIRSINKLIRVGRTEVVVVLRVDKDKGYIDLSKRRVSPEDIAKCEEKYNKSKAVHSIIRHVSETCKIKQEDLYKQFGWYKPRPRMFRIRTFAIHIRRTQTHTQMHVHYPASWLTTLISTFRPGICISASATPTTPSSS